MAGEKSLSTFRRPPSVADLSDADKVAISVHGARNWIKMRDARNWDELADKAVGLMLGGASVSVMCECLGVDECEFRQHLDVEKMKAFIHGEVARQIYSMALEGDEKMLRFLAETKLGWHKKTESEINVNGNISIQPILNMHLLTAEEEHSLRNPKALPDIEVK